MGKNEAYLNSGGTKESAEYYEWLNNLKIGDEVLITGHRFCNDCIEKITKITKASFFYGQYKERFRKSDGHIIGTYNDKARAVTEKDRIKSKRLKIKSQCRHLINEGRVNKMSLEDATTLLKLLEKYK